MRFGSTDSKKFPWLLVASDRRFLGEIGINLFHRRLKPANLTLFLASLVLSVSMKKCVPSNVPYNKLLILLFLILSYLSICLSDYPPVPGIQYSNFLFHLTSHLLVFYF